MKKRLSVLVLALAMILTMSASVFATPKATAEQTDTAANAKLVKYLKVGDGVAIPDTGYTFTFTALDSHDITVTDNTVNPATTHKQTTAALADYPAGTDGKNFTYTIPKTALGSAGISGTNDQKAAVSIADIFSGKTFASAGEYTYEVTENKGTETFNIDADTSGTLTYDTQKYTLHIYVKNDGDNTVIDSVTVEKADGTKVDPSDDDPTPAQASDRESGDYKADGFTFTNNYEVIIDDQSVDDPTTDYAGFGVSKSVAGDFASKTKAFTIEVTVNKPAGFSGTTGKYSVNNGTEQEFTYGTKFTVDIKHGENFGVTEMALGSHVVINEPAVEYYTATTSGLFTKDNLAANTACGNTGTGEAVAIGTSNKGTTQAFVNTMKDEDAPTPTGIIINNLPYVLLIGLALGGIVLFSRKRRYE